MELRRGLKEHQHSPRSLGRGTSQPAPTPTPTQEHPEMLLRQPDLALLGGCCCQSGAAELWILLCGSHTAEHRQGHLVVCHHRGGWWQQQQQTRGGLTPPVMPPLHGSKGQAWVALRQRVPVWQQMFSRAGEPRWEQSWPRADFMNTCLNNRCSLFSHLSGSLRLSTG